MPKGVPVFDRQETRIGWEDLAGRAACRNLDRELWFPPSDGPSRRLGDDAGFALAICADCPVRAECLAYAVDAHEEGIWGGTGTEERRMMRRRTTRREHTARARDQQREAS